MCQCFGISKDHVLDTGLLEGVIKSFRIFMNALVEGYGAGVEVEQTDFLVELGWVGEYAAEGRLDIGLADTAKCTDSRESVQMIQSDS